MKDGGVRIQTNAAVANISTSKAGSILSVSKPTWAKWQAEILTHSCIGANDIFRPETGSTAMGLFGLRKMGTRL